MSLPFDDEHAPLYTVGQVAGMLDVQPAFLRRIDAENVVQPARSDGGQRRYSRSDITRVHRVSEMAGVGMTLAGIRHIFMLEADNLDAATAVAARVPAARMGGAVEVRPIVER